MREALTPELLAQARTAETPEALQALAQSHGVTATLEEARKHFGQLHQTGALADEELENVVGGCGGGDPKPKYKLNATLCMTRDNMDALKCYCPDCVYGRWPAAIVKSVHYSRGDWSYSLVCANHLCPVPYNGGPIHESYLTKY